MSTQPIFNEEMVRAPLNALARILNEAGYLDCDPAGRRAIHESLHPAFRQILDQYEPDKHLAVYGTLMPGRTNYQMLEHIPGKWLSGKITGELSEDGWGLTGGYPAVIWKEAPPYALIPVKVLRSEQLASHWDRLDAFEGGAYRRQIVPVRLGKGRLLLSNIYVLRNNN